MTLFYGGDQRYRIRLADSNIAGDKARRELLKIRRPGLQQMHFGGVNCQFRDLLILRREVLRQRIDVIMFRRELPGLGRNDLVLFLETAVKVCRIYVFIKSQRRHHEVRTLCDLLDVTRSGYYAWLKELISNRARDDARLLRLIRASFAASHGIYGSLRVFLDLREVGETCSKHRVVRLTRVNYSPQLLPSRGAPKSRAADG